MNDAARRRQARGWGLEAEFLARVWLRAGGWRILDHGYSAGGGEIDIVARRGDLVIFVEVKARATRDAALLAIDAAKQRRMAGAARRWIARHPRHAACSFRGDALLLTPWRWPRRVAGAIPLDLGPL